MTDLQAGTVVGIASAVAFLGVVEAVRNIREYLALRAFDRWRRPRA